MRAENYDERNARGNGVCVCVWGGGGGPMRGMKRLKRYLLHKVGHTDTNRRTNGHGDSTIPPHPHPQLYNEGIKSQVLWSYALSELRSCVKVEVAVLGSRP